MSDTTSMREQRIYELRATLSQHNYVIHQFEEETGLKLSSYTLEKGGFRTAWLGSIIELVGEDAQKSEFFPYKNISNDFWEDFTYMNRVERALWGLKKVCQARKEMLPQFQRLWENAKYCKDEVEIYYGLKSARLTIPIEVLAKYQMFFNMSKLPRCCSYRFSPKSGKLCFTFDWCDPALLEFDNKLFFVDWRVKEYHEQKLARQQVNHFLAKCERFDFWESMSLETKSAPS